ncbi:hypothetical protein PCE1_001750 [Barthelona sp. PCE]
MPFPQQEAQEWSEERAREEAKEAIGDVPLKLIYSSYDPRSYSFTRLNLMKLVLDSTFLPYIEIDLAYEKEQVDEFKKMCNDYEKCFDDLPLLVKCGSPHANFQHLQDVARDDEELMNFLK